MKVCTSFVKCTSAVKESQGLISSQIKKRKHIIEVISA